MSDETERLVIKVPGLIAGDATGEKAIRTLRSLTILRFFLFLAAVPAGYVMISIWEWFFGQ